MCMIDHSKLSEGCCGQSYTLQELPVFSPICGLQLSCEHLPDTCKPAKWVLMTDIWGSDLCDASHVNRIKQACLKTLATYNTLTFACYQLQQIEHLSQDCCMHVSCVHTYI